MADVNLILQVGSESAAVAYAQQANASAQASAASAERASELATAASESATQAANSESAAAASATQANGYATAAGESASAAAQSAAAAETAKTNAENSATAAASSAQAASGSASDAAQSAAQASGSATSAASSATEASGSAAIADTKASEAASSASSASASATAAETAQTAAESAQTAAEEARDAAEEYAESIDPDTLAKKDGYYEELASGEAEQLISSVYREDTEPYFFRPIDGNAREYLDEIVGGSLAWNQLGEELNATNWAAETNVTLSFTDGIATFQSATYGNGIREIIDTPIVVGHKYIWIAEVKASASETTLFCSYGTSGSSGSNIPNIPTSFSVVGAVFVGRTGASGARVYLYASTNKEVSVKWLMLIDLTAEFGTTIADYIYSLETATAGTGVAWLRQYIDIDSYHPYSVSTLKHVEGLASHDTVGFNQWDEEWELGRISSATGANETDISNIRSKNYIPVIPQTQYYIKINATVLIDAYDANKNFIKYIKWSGGNAVFTISADTIRFIRFCTMNGSMQTYNYDICINLSDPQKNGTYEPYIKRTYPLDSSVVLRGKPILVDGKLKYNGDRYLPDGTINRRFNILDLGSLDYSKSSTITNGFVATANMPSDFPLAPSTTAIPNWVSAYVVTSNVGIEGENVDKAICWRVSYSNKGLIIRDSAYSSYYANNDMAAFKAAMSGNYLVYEKDTPTTESAEPYRQRQICDPYGTEEFVTTSPVPVGTTTRFSENLTAKIEGLPWDLSMIAPIENGTTASQAYTTGQYFLRNNTFCKAKTAIASGATFTLGTNYEVTTIAAELYTALH